MPIPGLQTKFFSRVADSQSVRMMFEHLPGVFFFIKDDQGRFMAANNAACVRFGVKGEQELIGATDADFLPHEVAKAYRDDDRRVIRSGKPIINRIEPFYDEQRRLVWFLTTKLPLLDRHESVIGVMGIARRDEKRMMHHDVREVAVAVQFAHANCHRVSTTQEMAKAAGVSERQLHRKLHTTLGLSPYELLLRIRVQSSAEALAQTSKPIIEIALDHGFCDQSAFTLQFRKRTGLTPREFRLGYLG